MKVLVAVFLLLTLFSCQSKNDEKYFLSTDFNGVYKQAKKHDKNIFIDFYTVWCGGCKGYDTYIFTDTSFQDYLRKGFYSLKINAELENNKEIVNRYAVRAYPTIIIADKNGDEIDRIIGYRQSYSEDIPAFINKIEGILRGEETLNAQLERYHENPDSIELIRKIIWEEFDSKGDIKNLEKFILEARQESQNKNTVKELNYWYGYVRLKDADPDPGIHRQLISEFENDSMLLGQVCTDLLYYYERKDVADSIDFFYRKLLNFSPDSRVYFLRRFARFLYKSNRDITLANELTKEYSKIPGADEDHWTPYLVAFSYAYKNQLDKGIDLYDKWMEKYALPENKQDNFWNYYFYIDFALYYKTNLEKALVYAELLEELNPNAENKEINAQILYLLNRKEQAVEKLKEMIPLLQKQKDKDRIDELIEEYSIK